MSTMIRSAAVLVLVAALSWLSQACSVAPAPELEPEPAVCAQLVTTDPTVEALDGCSLADDPSGISEGKSWCCDRARTLSEILEAAKH